MHLVEHSAMGQGINAIGLIVSAAGLAVLAGILLGRLEDILEASRRRAYVRDARQDAANRRLP